jgi:N6-adenosine-specific RNA methylase IME4
VTNEVVVLGFDEWADRGRQLCSAWKCQGWEIGDWWRDGSHRYGERARAAAQNIFGLEFKTLRNLGVVAGAFPTSRRRDNLTFNHHAEVAALPEEEADSLLKRASEESLSTRELRAEVAKIRSAAQIHAPVASADTCTIADLTQLAESGKRFGTIYADPPWLYDNQGTRAATGNHYGGMTVDELCALPVRKLADDDAHLHLWITNGFLFDAPRIFDAWGFEFRSTFVWVKPQMGIGNYWRVSHEFMLLGVRGSLRFRRRDQMSWLSVDRGIHSRKPKEVRQIIEKVSLGPFLELYGREPLSAPWTVYGNDVLEHNW